MRVHPDSYLDDTEDTEFFVGGTISLADSVPVKRQGHVSEVGAVVGANLRYWLSGWVALITMAA